jgi:hypothetical protein
MNTLILRGGLLLINRQTSQYEAVNIFLRKSPTWKSGILYLNQSTPLYKVYGYQNNFIELLTLKDKYAVLVNDAIIYESDQKFSYSVNVKLNERIKDIPFESIFKYY